MKKIIPDLLLVIGFACVSYGAWLVQPPAGFIVAGGMLIYTGIRMAVK